MSLEWHGDAHKKRLIKAAKKGIDKTLKEAATHARANHPGWESRSGKAEQSIKVLQAAEVDSKKVVSGLWGSTGVYYMRFLEHDARFSFATRLVMMSTERLQAKHQRGVEMILAAARAVLLDPDPIAGCDR